MNTQGAQSLNEQILGLVFAAIDDVNDQSADGAAIEKKMDTPLLGSATGVDSLTFVNLVVAIEEQVHKALGKSVVLVDEDGMALAEYPFRTVATLTDYVERVVARS